MNASPSDATRIRRELDAVCRAAELARETTDATEMLRRLMFCRDRIVSAAMTIRTIDDDMRAKALAKLEITP